jgi:hypothetical protein
MLIVKATLQSAIVRNNTARGVSYDDDIFIVEATGSKGKLKHVSYEW